MNTLVLQKCLNHPLREAVARCPECAQPYCRECVIEHEGRVLCAACLRKASGEAGARAGLGKRVLEILQVAAAVLFLWLCFFALGKTLLAVPASFHEGDVWKSSE